MSFGAAGCNVENCGELYTEQTKKHNAAFITILQAYHALKHLRVCKGCSQLLHHEQGTQ